MKTKRLICTLLTLSLVFSVFSFSFAEEKEYYHLELTKVNQELLQAEDMTLDESITVIEESEGSFGGKHVKLLSGNTEAIAFNVTPSKVDQLVFWMRYQAENNSSNSVYFYMEGKKQLCELPVTGKDKYNWVKISTASFPKNIPHTVELRIVPKESGVIIDTFYITDDGTYYPYPNEEDFELKYEMLTQSNEGYPPSGLKPIAEHPRVFFTKDDIPRLQEAIYAEENKKAYDEWQRVLATSSDITGRLSGDVGNASSNRDDAVNAVIEACAFSYAITKNEEHGRRAIFILKNMLNSFILVPGEPYHEVVQNIWNAGIVYDWCFDLLTEEDREYIVYYTQNQIQEMGAWVNQGYPYNFKSVGVMSSALTITNPHYGPLAFSIAIYDEYPELFDYLSSVEVHAFREVGNYITQGGAHPSGSSYGPARMFGMCYAHYLLKTACEGFELYEEEALADMTLQWIYDKNPDGFRYRSGDHAVYTTANLDYASSIRDTAGYMIAMNLTDDPYKKSVFKLYSMQECADFGGFIYWQEAITPITIFVLNDTSVSAKSYSALPLTRYFPEPMGRMVAKTGWSSGIDSKDATVFMNIKTEVTTNHGHPDAGTFQIYYKGLVSPDLSNYAMIIPPHYYGYNNQTISHNGLLIYDPNEWDYGTGYNSGGQRGIHQGAGLQHPLNLDAHLKRKDKDLKTGEITGVEFGPDKYAPEYSYIAGDISAAYSDKVSEVRRSMMFMPTENEEAPAVFFVMDKINSTNASFKKTYLLQAFEEPEVNDNVVTLYTKTNGYNGSAVNQTLYPEVNIEAIGGPGKAWFVNGENLVPNGFDANTTSIGWGRVEVSPKEQQELDYLMNVIYVEDADSEAELKKAELIETDDLLGAKILNKAAVFAKASDRPSKEMSFKLEGAGKVDVAVAGLAKGEWEISVNGSSIGTEISTEEGGMIYFKADCGEISIKKISEKSEKEFSTGLARPEELAEIEFKYNGKLRYSETPLTIMNSTCYIPIETIFGVLNGEVTYSEDRKTASAAVGGTKLSVTEGSDKITMSLSDNDVSFNDSAPIISLNGSLMLPARKVYEKLGGMVKWGTGPQCLSISLDEDMLSISGEIPIVGSTMIEGRESSEDATMTYDRNRDTTWVASGDDVWIIWEFDNAYTIKSFMFDANRSIADRRYLFDLYYSQNGEDWSLMYSGSSPGDGSKLYYNLEFPVKAKYVKYVGHMNTNVRSSWNNLSEILFSTDTLDLSKFGNKEGGK